MSEQHFLLFAKYLAAAGAQAPSADNSQPIDFVWRAEERQLSLRFAAYRLSNTIFGPSDHATLLTLGAAIESISQAAASVGGVVSLQFGLEQSSGELCHFVLDELPDSDKALSSEVSLRQTNRFEYHRTQVPSEVILQLTNMVDGDVSVHAIVDHDAKHNFLTLVSRAAELRFRTEELHNWLMGSLRYQGSKRSDSGLDVATLNLPPGGALFMRTISDWRVMRILNALGAYKLLAMVESALLAKAPLVACIVADRTRSSSIAAGRLLFRAWTWLNSLGLAVHPYYVLTDQIVRWSAGKISSPKDRQCVEQIASRLPNLFGREAAQSFPHIILRIGYPTREAPKSRRLPMDTVFHVETL